MFTGRRLFPDLAASKSLIILVSGSIIAFVIALGTGMFRAIEVWERNSGLSKYHVAEFVTLLIVLGVAIVTFIYRQYGEMREASPDKSKQDEGSCPPEKRANYQSEQLETLFRRVEAAKKEWQLSLDSIRDMVILVELDGTIHRCNRAFKEFLGLSYEEILRKDIASLLKKFGIEMNGLDLRTLNARFHISGKWLGVRSYPYTDFETTDITRVVVIMLEVTVNRGTEEKVRFVWGNNVYSRLDGGKASSFQAETEMDVVDARTPGESVTKAIN